MPKSGNFLTSSGKTFRESFGVRHLREIYGMPAERFVRNDRVALFGRKKVARRGLSVVAPCVKCVSAVF